MTVSFEQLVERAKLKHPGKYSYGSASECVGLGAKRKLAITCSLHGLFFQQADNHIGGQGCPDCSKISRAHEAKKPYSFYLLQMLNKHNGTYAYPADAVLSLGVKTKINITCKTHGPFLQTIDNHKNGQGCPACGENLKGRASLTLDHYLEEVQEIHGQYKYLGIVKGYDGKSLLRVICPEHGEFTQDVQSHRAGSGCAVCGHERAGEKRLTPESEVFNAASLVHSNFYSYSKTYMSSSGRMLIANCPKHGEFSQQIANHLEGKGCSKCVGIISSQNTWLKSQIDALGYESVLEYRDKETLGRIAVDVYEPKNSLAVEHLGLHWHSSRTKHSSFLLERKRLVESTGRKFLAFYEDELATKPTAVKALLRSRLGAATKKIGARECSVKHGKAIDHQVFLGINHIQGYIASGVSVSLSDKFGIVVAVAVFNFNTSNRATAVSDNLVELTRYATCQTVVGGLSKLLKAFLKAYPLVQKVTSFSDNRLFTGNAYEKVGFTKDYVTAPDYSYVVGKTRKHKSGFQKSRLMSQHPEFTEDMSEKAMTEKLGIYRIYDCGKTKWSYTP